MAANNDIPKNMGKKIAEALKGQDADAISFAILIVILLVKPTGLFGSKRTVKV